MKLRGAFLLLFLLPAFVPAARLAAQSKSHHVVFALTSDDSADWQMAMGNIRNLFAGLPAGTVEVEVVAYGSGITMVKKGSAEEKDIEALIAQQVHFVGCENSMRKRNITKDDLLPGVGTVPSGIIEIVTKQEQGWSYIKGGK